MLVTVISDTHIFGNRRVLPNIVLDSVARTGLLIHAGDFIDVNFLDYLETLTRVEAVAGNNDGPEIAIRLGSKKLVELNGYKIGIIHGDGHYGTALARAKQAFVKDNVDIVIFGHSHQPYNQVEDGVLYFNPGSPTDKRMNDKFSYGELDLGDELRADIFYF